MKRNTTGQKFRAKAFNSSGSVTGEASNITCELSKDGGAFAPLGDTNPVEVGTSGVYEFDLTQAETDAHDMCFIASCSTGGVEVLGLSGNVIVTEDETRLAKLDRDLAHAGDAGSYKADVSGLMLAASYLEPDNDAISEINTLLDDLTEDDGSGNDRFTQKALDHVLVTAGDEVDLTTQQTNAQWPEAEFGNEEPSVYYYGEDWTFIFTEGIPASLDNGEKIVFAIKELADLDTIPDADSVVEVELTIGGSSGLTRLNGASSTSNWASLVYEDNPSESGAKRVVVTVKDDATQSVDPATYHRGLKIVGESDVLQQDTIAIAAPVTKAIT